MHFFHKLPRWINTNGEHQSWRGSSQLSNGTSPNSKCYLSNKLCIDEVRPLKLNYRSLVMGQFWFYMILLKSLVHFLSLTLVKHVGVIKEAFLSSLGSKVWILTCKINGGIQILSIGLIIQMTHSLSKSIQDQIKLR